MFRRGFAGDGVIDFWRDRMGVGERSGVNVKAVEFCKNGCRSECFGAD